MKRFLAICLTLTLLMGVLPIMSASAETTMVVTGGWLRLRALPNFTATTLASYYTGTKVTVYGTAGDGNWYHVRASDGYEGYMYGKYLKASGDSGSTSTATVISSNGLGVRLRTGPSVAYGIIQVVPVGTTVTVLAKGTYWWFIRVGTQTGYMMSQYLTDGATPTPSSGYLARVTSKNGLGVRLRAGAGTGYAVLGVYSVGTEVTVLTHGSTWDYIRIGSRTGYMMTQFLTTSQVVNTVSKVALNNASPKVGDTLVAVVTPSAATVTYRWTYSDGTLVGTGSSYVVTPYDTGERIRITVTGTGLYTGTATSNLSNTITNSGTTLLGVNLSSYSPVVGQTLYATPNPTAATASYVWYRSDGTAVGAGQSYLVKSSDVGRTLYCVAVGTGSYSGTAYSSNTAAVTTGAVDTPLSGTLSISGFTTAGSTVTALASLNTTQVDYSWYLDGWLMSSGTSSLQVPNNAGSKLKVRATAKSGSGYTGYVESGEMTITESAAKQQLQGDISIPSTATTGSTVVAAPALNSSYVSYSWQLNGSTIVGATGSSITVSDSMAGGVLTVTATANGTDGYTGSVTSNSCAISAATPSPVAYTGTVSLPSTSTVGSVIYPSVTNNNASKVTYDWYVDGLLENSGDSSFTLTSSMAGKSVMVRITSLDSSVIGYANSNGCYVQPDLVASPTDN